MHTSNTFDVYDFDKTVYKGDASLRFYLFCLMHYPRVILYLPRQLWHACFYIVRLESRKIFKEHFFVFLRGLPDVDGAVDRFWASQVGNIKGWYREVDHRRDIVISASPEFLLQPICRLLQVSTLIATHMDKQTGVINGENCRAAEKVARLHQQFPAAHIRKAYSDSMSDLPLLMMAAEPYIVRGDTIFSLQDYTHRA